MESSHPKAKGERSEAAVIHAFLRHRVPVLQPFGDNERYDLVVDLSDTFYRVQVKTGRLEEGRVQFETRSSGTHTRAIRKEGYDGQIDVFAVYAPDLDETYVVPVADAPKTSMALRVAAPKKTSPNINWASDFSLDSWVASVRGTLS